MPSRHFRYKQLAGDIEGRIRRGDLRPGEKLPSLRVLRGKLGLSLNTVYQAYVELETMGLVVARPKSGFFVRNARVLKGKAPRFARSAPPPRKVRLADITNTVVANALDPGLVPFGASILMPEMVPGKHLARIIRRLSVGDAAAMLHYAPTEGLAPLRRRIAGRMVGMAPAVQEHHVTITNGCTEAVALALLATTRRGDVVAVESPTHFGFLQLLRELGRLVLELPTDPRHGLVTRGLPDLLCKHRVRAGLVMPNFHNPMGTLMSKRRKMALVNIFSEAGIPLIEDDIYAEMYFGTNRPRLLKHWDRHDTVITCSSFTKVLAPGFRVGWVVAGGKAANRIRRLKGGLSLSTPTLQQLALAQFLDGGALDRHLRLLRAAVHREMTAMAVAVKRAFPEDSRLIMPKGGNMLWVELPPGVDGIRLYQEAMKNGISIVPGAAFTATDRFGNYIRLSCTTPFSGRMAAAVETLGELAGGGRNH